MQRKKYLDITEKISKNNNKEYKIEKQDFFINRDGKRYNVDGKHVIMEPTIREKEVANLMGQILGGKVNIIPRINYPKNIKTPDYIINKEKYDLKTLMENNKHTIYNAIHKQKMQASNFIIDISKNGMSQAEAEKQIESIYNSIHTKWVKQMILIKRNKLLKIYQRK